MFLICDQHSEGGVIVTTVVKVVSLVGVACLFRLCLSSDQGIFVPAQVVLDATRREDAKPQALASHGRRNQPVDDHLFHQGFHLIPSVLVSVRMKAFQLILSSPRKHIKQLKTKTIKLCIVFCIIVCCQAAIPSTYSLRG